VVIARRFWRPPQTDDIVAVSLVQEAGHTIKWLEILADGSWKLKPRNPDHPEKTVQREQIKAAAVVVGWYHPVHKPRQHKRA
jgi:SOS-response transcriptional repressor LexA